MIITACLCPAAVRTLLQHGGMNRPERTLLVEQHLPLVRSIAARMVHHARPYLELDDLVAIGTEALLRASERFDAGRAVPFGSFAYLRVRGAMCEGIGEVGPYRRGRYRRRYGRAPRPAAPSLCAFDETRAPSTTAGRRDRQEEIERSIDVSILGPRIRAALTRLDQCSREMIERHYFAGETLRDIGLEMGHGKSWASRIHARAIDQLRCALDAVEQSIPSNHDRAAVNPLRSSRRCLGSGRSAE